MLKINININFLSGLVWCVVAILFVLKIAGFSNISWFLVFSPLLLTVFLGLLFFVSWFIKNIKEW